MGVFSAIGNFISGVGRAISNGISTLCHAIGGTALGKIITEGVTKLAAVIGVAFPPLEIINAILLVADIVSKMAEALGLKEKEKDDPDELAMKAEKSDKKPEDFDSTEAYIRHLQKEIELTDEDKEKLESMDDEKRSAYRATGTYLYTKYINEKLGFDNTGLKNPELIGITAEILTDLAKLSKVILPSDFVVYSRYLLAGGLTLNNFSDYLNNRSESIAVDRKVQEALAGAMKEIKPDITKDEIDKKLSEMNIED